MKQKLAIFGMLGTRLRNAAFVTATLWICLVILTACSPAQKESQPPELSNHTREILKGLQKPVQIRFYSILDAAKVDAAYKPFANNARELLNAYAHAAPGKLTVTVYDSQSDSNVAAAIADGMKAFNLEKGDASFMGFAVQAGDNKTTMPFLSPNYETALESDLTRAIEETVAKSKAVPASQASAEPDPATIEHVKAAVPDYASVPLEAGVRKLREGMLNDLVKQGQENQARIAELQAALQRVQQSGNAAEQEAARKAVADAERENAERLQEIIARSTSEIRALEMLKNGK